MSSNRLSHMPWRITDGARRSLRNPADCLLGDIPCLHTSPPTCPRTPGNQAVADLPWTRDGRSGIVAVGAERMLPVAHTGMPALGPCNAAIAWGLERRSQSTRTVISLGTAGASSLKFRTLGERDYPLIWPSLFWSVTRVTSVGCGRHYGEGGGEDERHLAHCTRPALPERLVHHAGGPLAKLFNRPLPDDQYSKIVTARS